MRFSTQDHTLRGILAGVVVLASLSACSRPDRADRGRDTTAVDTTAVQTGAAVQPDTQVAPAVQPPMGDTVRAKSKEKTPATNRKESASRTATQSSVPSVEDSTGETSDYSVSGYRAMGHDSSTAGASDTSAAASSEGKAAPGGDASVSDTTASVPDTSSTEMAGAALDSAANRGNADTATTGYAPATADTTTSVAQADTSAHTNADIAVTAQTDTSAANESDSTAQPQAQVAATNRPDTAVVVGDSAEVGKPGERLNPGVASADTAANQPESDRVRPPVDSTEATASNPTADNQPTGAARTTEMATDADAVALVSRQGLRSTVMTGDWSARQWDMASTPVTLNPCGLGTMQLSRIWTGEEK